MSVITVFQLNEYLRRLILRDAALARVAVSGEISGFKKYPSGHIYFTLKDEQAAVQCVFFRGANRTLDFVPAEGTKVVATGTPTIYSRDGRYQLVVECLEQTGDGELYRRFEELKARLQAEGLFDEGKKRPIPLLPRRVGVVTSRAGAVFSDILRVSAQRDRAVDILLAPVPVQGADAPRGIVEGLRLIQNYDIDTVIIGRGGGSVEDLWCFNDEQVVRAVSKCRVPVISAVGHETDYTLCDFAADVRAATPTHAAQLAVPDVGELRRKVSVCLEKAGRAVSGDMQRRGFALKAAENHYMMKQPEHQLDAKRQQLDTVSAGAAACMEKTITQGQAALAQLCRSADALSPLRVLARGYSVVNDAGGRCVTSAGELEKGGSVSIRFYSGSAQALITEVHDDGGTQ